MDTQTMDAVQQVAPTLEPVSTETRVGRRRFTAETKRRILAEAATCKHGEIGLLLRREGIYSSMLKRWRMEADAGKQGGSEPKKRGPKALAPKAEHARLQREIDRLQHRLSQAELIIDVQKKLCTMLGLTPAEVAL
jgi:transposase